MVSTPTMMQVQYIQYFHKLIPCGRCLQFIYSILAAQIDLSIVAASF